MPKKLVVIIWQVKSIPLKSEQIGQVRDDIHDPWWRKHWSQRRRSPRRARPCGPASPEPPPRPRTTPAPGSLGPTRAHARLRLGLPLLISKLGGAAHRLLGDREVGGDEVRRRRAHRCSRRS